MRLVPISAVAEAVKIGQPLRFGVFDASGVLLLASGFVVTHERMLEALIRRGFMVDKDEIDALQQHAAPLDETPPQLFFRRWTWLHQELDAVLRAPHPDSGGDRLRNCVQCVIDLSDTSPDLLIFLIVRHDQARYESYGVFHAIHVAAAAGLIAQRLKWREQERVALVGAALTMNLAITELQGVLALQRQPPNEAQREQIRNHPLAAASALRAMGITDDTWLSTVEQHHEIPGGEGYPMQLEMSTTLAQVLRCIDIFLVKLSARATRLAELPNVAARKLFIESPAGSLTGAVIKEFGIYPPGCYVRLASDEIAIVLRRGANANAPVVAALTNADNCALAQPVLRHTTRPEFAVCEIVGPNAVFVRPDWGLLHAMSYGH
jgi:HD-GYP domain-containing protein (c-di-GMP phosphodiesterase class II)